MVKKLLLEDLKKVLGELGYETTDIVLSISKNPTFGDYSTNLALQLAKSKTPDGKRSPTEIANEIVIRVKNQESSKGYLEKVEIAGGGFINFFIKDQQLIKYLKDAGQLRKSKRPQKILVEYGHVNPLKEIHIGHLRTFILGESLCRIFESLGNKVFRANYQGDIGLHIAKAIWGIEELGLPTKELSLEEKAEFLGEAYAKGNNSYEVDPQIKKKIDQINVQLYESDPKIKEIYKLARDWSLEYFEPIYKLLGVKYDRCFFESEVFEGGKQIVMKNLRKVFEKNDGAIIFPAKIYGLHNRVFITSAGHATYEGKEIGLAKLEYESFNYDNSIHVVASEQDGYFEVVIKAIELIFPNLIGKKFHLSYGVVDLKEGKMSSRAGNVVTVDDLYHVVCEKVREVMKKSRLEVDQKVVEIVAMGAIKFSYLKYSPRPNMIFDLEESVSLEGDSGPYVQYTYARIQSLLKKAKGKSISFDNNESMDKEERQILVQLLYFPEIVEEVAKIYHPNLLASYLLDLSKFYNLFYQKFKIIGSEKENLRLGISKAVGDILAKGLYLLGIEAPERM